ncbi:MAG: HAD-IIIC family phosphatase [Gemmatimonadales bacterium]
MIAPTRPGPATSQPLAVADLIAAVAGVPVAPDWAACVGACRALDALAERLPDALRARVAVVGSATLDPLVAFLRVAGARAGLWLDVYVAPYGQYLQELLQPTSGLYAFRPHVTVVAIDAEALWEMRWAGGAPRGAAQVAGGLVERVLAGAGVFTEHGSGVLLVNDFAALRGSAGGVNGFRDEGGFTATLTAANQALTAGLSHRPSALVFPFADVLAEVGRLRAVNWRTHYRGHVTWSDALMAQLADRYVGYALAAVGRATKCIVLDLDNTLWGGVLGEDGPDGIAIGPGWPGREYLDFQRQLLELQRQGILLALCSKNNLREVIPVLRDHPGMLIRESHLAAWRVNWDDKATNLRALALELNLSVGHLLFLDDSPHERAWVRRQLPELPVPDLPDDPARWADWIARLPSLTLLHRTAEDARRTEQYHEQRAREEFRQGIDSVEAFLRGLELRVTIDAVRDATFPRVAQLLAKTSQFNLTTRRHDEVTLRRRVAEGWRVYTMHVTDTFGDFGLTGVAIAVPEAESWHLDSFLMSCRVIGKSVETALLARIASDAKAAGAASLTAEFIDSGRNEPARGFLGDHGFTPRADGRLERALADGGPAWPAWIQRVGGAEPRS